MGPFAQVCSKDARPPRTRHCGQPIPSSSLGSAVSCLLRPLTSKIENFHTAGHSWRLHPCYPLLLSPATTTIEISASKNLPEVVTASMIAALSTLCPNLQHIIFDGLPRDPVITAAVSGLLLTINRNILQHFWVDSPLFEGACKVIYKLPGLRKLRTIIDGPTVLPTLVLPSLIELSIEYDGGHDWLQGSRGASLGKSTSVSIHSDSDSIDDFLGEFESVALTTSIPATLLEFTFYTSSAWRPNYRSLLPFTHLKNSTSTSFANLSVHQLWTMILSST